MLMMRENNPTKIDYIIGGALDAVINHIIFIRFYRRTNIYTDYTVLDRDIDSFHLKLL